VKFLIDECLHFSLVRVAQQREHEAYHINWLGLSGRPDWYLMKRIIDEDVTFVTNNARDFRKLYSRAALHAGLVIIVQQVEPVIQRRLFNTVLQRLGDGRDFVNEVIEISPSNGEAPLITRYAWPRALDT
jgi:predicted nuclease of predicted toxin-antitoxin system